jgi:hypothetical protein
MISGERLFQEDYFDSVKYIQYYAPDETVTIIDDPTTMKKIWNMMCDNLYEEYEGEQLIGGYDFRLIFDNRITYITLDNAHFSIDGKQYNSKEPLADKIFEYSGIK